MTRLLLVIGLFSCLSASAQKSNWKNTPKNYLNRALKLRFSEPEMAYLLFEQNYDLMMQKGDTVNAINTLVEWSKLHAHHANFSSSYDKYWEALKLADQANLELSKATVYSGLGWLYSLFYRYDDAKLYFNKSISIYKKSKDPEIASKRSTEYWALAILYRKLNITDTARIFLDSCVSIKGEKSTNKSFYQTERAYCDFIDGDVDKALETLLPLEKRYLKHNPSYMVYFHYFLGQIYEAKGQLTLANDRYNRALKRGEIHLSHQDIIPDILIAKANLNKKMGHLAIALEAMTQAKIMSDSLFSSRSSLNQALLEIKDEFRQQKEEQIKVIQAQKIEQLEQEERVWRLRTTLTYMGVLMVAITGLFFYRHIRNRHKAEKKIMKERQQLELEKTNEILDLKNRELTASALQILKRDETIKQIKQQIKEQKNSPDQKSLNSIVNTINLSQADDWQEFESRFVSINQSFYDTLKKRYTNLTPSDLKLCALIKLGFNSKELAGLLGLSIESTHTTRYRLRKKLGLTRQDNLEKFISDLT
ncbi:tetratricopeptide repeat protein [Reichenbachiella versicolor]|uniref:tetratricopeptide repeat protein n=1 Tax=Reichenbachiella versicolor TaxID=1821036 RepID=UPI000D6E159B|nr:hypothetical protein [Reichenbachiella versicolor]